ncbi:MAG: penicillin-binding protein 2, partial [Deltaproteobacteria bacterium]|nr:penicillin-binding protein 2 [Deltaproteobacteria bacterium]
MSQADPQGTTRWIRLRVALVLLALLGLLGIIGWRAHRLQLVEGAQLREMAEQQYLRNIRLPSRRGTIFDRNRAPLAISVDVESIYANPRMIGSKAPEVAAALAPILGLEASALQGKLRSRRYFRWLKRRVSDDEAKAVRALGIRGIFLQKESRRFYPNRNLGATVVGFVGIDALGLEGLELSLDRWLRGGHIKVSGLRDARGKPLLTKGLRDVPNMSHDVILALDKVIQFETEQALAAVLKEHKPKWAAAVVLDIRNGDVLAMASAPAFDPNHYGRFKSKLWRNRTVTDAFEPGSTLKIFSVAAALHAGVCRDDELIDGEKGHFRIGRHVIHDSKPHEMLSVADVLKKSSNICVSKLAIRLGAGRLHRALRRFGFGAQTKIGLPGER